ncbi:molybdopterin converting factor subunit 1 [Pyrococcus furiosus DSM 3638]|uniref:Molybdopterin converting factor, subunit 1 n=3 Tax=Pyrococcus furiosus TaxID=2261 RepID=Q8U3C7_PYRFU|nr:ubiquitin-like small modifier protein 1 [Pyrococcus furiosus]AAL80667.1 molybdopterin converting factor, subunit 1 [Pyrococcus furiosus DSM 3638]AFN03339.1 molybdopterin converting factor subunit 1 [Pyrococcus furiosus COM1]QEK78254.1 molybdopterin converting factor subunit 1 [Pyrococcus furiosus DSM 3638]
MVKVKVKYFARFRQLAGVDEEEIELPEGARVRDLIEEIKKRHEKFKEEVFGEGYDEDADVNIAVNGRYVSWDEELKDGDVVGVFPPVSGG